MIAVYQGLALLTLGLKTLKLKKKLPWGVYFLGIIAISDEKITIMITKCRW